MTYGGRRSTLPNAWVTHLVPVQYSYSDVPTTICLFSFSFGINLTFSTASSCLSAILRGCQWTGLHSRKRFKKDSHWRTSSLIDEVWTTIIQSKGKRLDDIKLSLNVPLCQGICPALASDFCVMSLWFIRSVQDNVSVNVAWMLYFTTVSETMELCYWNTVTNLLLCKLQLIFKISAEALELSNVFFSDNEQRVGFRLLQIWICLQKFLILPCIILIKIFFWNKLIGLQLWRFCDQPGAIYQAEIELPCFKGKLRNTRSGNGLKKLSFQIFVHLHCLFISLGFYYRL